MLGSMCSVDAACVFANQFCKVNFDCLMADTTALGHFSPLEIWRISFIPEAACQDNECFDFWTEAVGFHSCRGVKEQLNLIFYLAC